MPDRREVVLPNRLSPAEMFPAGDSRFRIQMVTLENNERVRVVECGPADSHDVVVCVHGWGCSVYSYRDVMPWLGDSGRRVIAFDLRGHGLSDKPEGKGLYTIDALAWQIERLCAQLGIERAVFVGHSMGSGTLARFAALYPQRVAGLVLTAPVGFKKTVNMRLAMSATPDILTPLLPRLVTRSLIARIIRMAFGNPAVVTSRDIDEYWAPSQFPAFARCARGALHEFDWVAGGSGKFDGITAPVTIIYGTKDTLVPPEAAQAYERVVSGASYVAVVGCGHAIPDEAPGDVVDAILALGTL